MLQLLRTLPLVLTLLLAASAARADCTADDFNKAVDQAGADLRAFNLANAPRMQSRIAELKVKKGWSDDNEDMAYNYLTDARMTGFDEGANHLLDRIDTLGRVEAGAKPDCARLDELKAATVELLAVMKAKTAYTMAKLDKELSGGTSPTAKSPAPSQGQSKSTAAAPTDARKPDEAAQKPAQTVGAAPPAKPAPPKPAPAAKPANPAWTTSTEVAAAAPPPPAVALPPGALMEPGEGYTIEEIKEVTRGVFGTVSTNLAAVLEHAFSSFGRPTAYVLGKEGGGAFLAGVRYGSGTLYPRQGNPRQVHWHGPSLGYDVGVAGSRTLFLVYGLKDADKLYRTYTGIDGSAYVVGGIGLTVLKGGPVVMAPIRSGVGLRVGASLGYIRFTREKSWNPF